MSRRSVIRSGAAGIAAAALAAGLLAVGAGPGIAEEPTAPVSEPAPALALGALTPAPVPPRPSTDDAQAPALGIIVGRTGSRAALKTASATAESAIPGVIVVNTAALMPDMDVLNFDRQVPAATALRVAARIAALPGVAWAEPNYLRFPLSSEPVFPTDPLWGEQWDMWDATGSDGGYGIKAPYAWATTKGSPDVVVAVLDTGITRHPDLDSNVVAGYDFVSNPLNGNDNDPRGSSNSRDRNPADPGDWITRKESQRGQFRGCPVSPSSWHGTHVAGTIAAIADNGIGISGVAPNVKIQPVRVLGKCGGTTADSVAAITWASGGRVPGVPANQTPADVLNMSLGGGGMCARSEQRAIDGAISRGSSIVVAAGNSAKPLAEFSPASCNGVIRVGATTRAGSLSGFSNYGVPGYAMTLSAPGGAGQTNPPTNATDILSTLNSGARRPASPTYAAYPGTSMAAPHVAGAAALLYSQGITTPSEVTTRLQAAVQPFPVTCPAVNCGAGILDLSRLFADGPTPPPPPPPSTIGAPTNVTWEPAGSGRINIYFTPPTIPAGTTIDYYQMQATGDGVTWLDQFQFPGTYVDVQVVNYGSYGTYALRFAAVLTDGRRGGWSPIVIATF